MPGGGDEITLGNCLNKKCVECTSGNDIHIKIPCFLYILVYKSILYNCELQAEESFHFASIATSTGSPNQQKKCTSQLIWYLSVILTTGQTLLGQLSTLI